MILYSVNYDNYTSRQELICIVPHSDYIEDLFYNGSLLRNVDTSDTGHFRLDVWLKDEGDFEIEAKFKYRGWVEVDV